MKTEHGLIGVVALMITGLALAGVQPLAQPQVQQREGFQDFFAQVADNVYVAGQPTAAALASLQQAGVTTVINLRTPAEMNNRDVVPFDEAQTVKALGMDYIHIPQGGPDTPYSPAALARVAQALDQAEGKVLLHCTVAWRASHMWAAYLVAHRDFSVAQAVAVGKQMNMGGFPFAEFLGREVSVAEEPAQ